MKNESSNKIEVLKKYFPYSKFLGEQEKIISHIERGESVLAIQPTGSGKSLTYQYPAKVWPGPGLVLVISPLISLMSDQVLKAKNLAIRASFINSSLGSEERKKRMSQIKDYQLLFVTPERFRIPEFLEAIATVPIKLLAADEAHCISQWGHDFRPDYSRLGEIRRRLGDPTTLALTATATADVQMDILTKLRMADAPVVWGGIERPNLDLSVKEVWGFEEKVAFLWDWARERGGVGVVYCSLIETVKKISRAIELKGPAFPLWNYYGELAPGQKNQALNSFLAADSGVMIATPAFGLGIDKPNIRWVIHAEIPGSIEAYYQEVGRAGRDGLAARGVLLYDESDVEIQMEFLKWSHPEVSFLFELYRLIREGSLELQQRGFDFLRERMSYKNKRDYRSEAGVRILERLGYVQRLAPRGSLFPYAALEEPDPKDLEAQVRPEHLKMQQKKLLEMVRLASLSSSEIKERIYEYFRPLS